jgi:prevent-host-death family protein
MNKDHVTVTASKFKATCLDLLDQLDTRKITKLIVTKRGRPVAVLTPAEVNSETPSVFGCLRGSVVIPDGVDLTAPILDESLFAADGRIHE